MRGKGLLIAGITVLAALSAGSAAAPLLTRYSPTDQLLDLRFARPGQAGHVLGTDELGRDVFARLLFGARSPLLVGAATVGIAGTAGLALGLAAALARPLVRAALLLTMDALLSFPTILLAIVVVSLLGYGLGPVVFSAGIVFTPLFARLVRAEVLGILAEDYIESARALGSSTGRLIVVHILPGLWGKLAVQGSIVFALAIVIEASLSYLGLGAQPPTPSWGLMLKDARNYFFIAPWLAVFPGLAIAFAVLGFNVVGDVLNRRS